MNNLPPLAFPHTWEAGDGTTIVSKGMTLRDYFAAKAMQTLMDESNDIARTKLWIAITAYSMADAMLKERQ